MSLPSPSVHKKRKIDSSFNSLTENAFEFIEKSISEFEKSPKFSIINFCAALEMLLKAKLLKEHWTLVVSKIESADLSKFLQGDFASITLDQSFNRLKAICDINIPDSTIKLFREIASHRNKLIHFYHEELKNDSQTKTTIILEQSRAWFHLQKLINEWDEFKPYKKQITSIEKKLVKHNHYIEAKFKEIEPDIKNQISAGKKFQKCQSCKCLSAALNKISEHIYSIDCMVCNENTEAVQVSCTSCQDEVFIDHRKICPICNYTLDSDEISENFYSKADQYLAAKEGIYDLYGNCSFCDGHHTVVQVDNKSLCCECFEINDYFGNCEWCNEPTNSSTEGSYAFGCSMCEGLSGHRRDD